MSEGVRKAAQWLAATPPAERPHPIIPHMRETYGLSAKEACEAVRKSHEIMARAH